MHNSTRQRSRHGPKNRVIRKRESVELKMIHVRKAPRSQQAWLWVSDLSPVSSIYRDLRSGCQQRKASGKTSTSIDRVAPPNLLQGRHEGIEQDHSSAGFSHIRLICPGSLATPFWAALLSGLGGWRHWCLRAIRSRYVVRASVSHSPVASSVAVTSLLIVCCSYSRIGPSQYRQ